MLRAKDWSATPLGPPSTWPESLHRQLNVCFDSPFAIAVWWGPDLIQSTIGPMVEQVMEQGIAVKGDDMPLTLDRNGYLELCNFTFSYSPIRDRDGVIHGMFTAAVKTTARVAGEQRQAIVVGDLHADSLFAAAAPAYNALGIRAVVIMPLIRSGRMRATFNVSHAAPRRWTPQDVTLLADIAERTWEALERARAEQALLASNRMKDEFLAMLAHELRNPLAPISAAADLLPLARLDTDKARSTSAIIRRQVAHLP